MSAVRRTTGAMNPRPPTARVGHVGRNRRAHHPTRIKANRRVNRNADNRRMRRAARNASRKAGDQRRNRIADSGPARAMIGIVIRAAIEAIEAIRATEATKAIGADKRDKGNRREQDRGKSCRAWRECKRHKDRFASRPNRKHCAETLRSSSLQGDKECRPLAELAFSPNAP